MQVSSHKYYTTGKGFSASLFNDILVEGQPPLWGFLYMSTPYRPNSNRNSYKIVTSGNGGDSFSTASDQSRMLPRQISTGSTRGTQTVGYGSVKIDGSNNRITVGANGTNITIGDTSDSDNSTGISLTDSQGNNLVLLGNTPGTSPTNGLTVYDSKHVRRLLAGSYPDGDIKIKLSQSGFDVATATDDQLIWSSDFNMFKIVQSGTAVIPALTGVTGTGVLATVNAFHNLGHAPSFLAYGTDFNNNIQQLPFWYNQLFTLIPSIDATLMTPYGYVYAISKVDRIVFNLAAYGSNSTLDGPFSSNEINIKYYLLQETAGTS